VLEVKELKSEVKANLGRANYILPNDIDRARSAASVSEDVDSPRLPSIRDVRPMSALFAGLALAIIGMLGSLVRADRPVPPTKTDSLAVLPFVNFDKDPKIDHFSDGLTAEITTRLGTIQRLRVPSRIMMLQYKNTAVDVGRICRAIKVRTLLEGSVRSQGDRLLITVNRVDVDGNHLWAETYDRIGNDLLGVQREVAARISEVLQKQVEGRRH
jgi:TolB-like protein